MQIPRIIENSAKKNVYWEATGFAICNMETGAKGKLAKGIAVNRSRGGLKKSAALSRHNSQLHLKAADQRQA